MATLPDIVADKDEPPLRVDVHTHIMPESWPDLRERYGYGGWVKFNRLGEKHGRMFRDDGTPFRDVDDSSWSLDRRLDDCKPVGVDVHVLSTVPVFFSYWAEPEHTLDLSMMLNDHISRCVASNPTRFAGLGTLPMQSPELACMELKRCVRELGLTGVQIGTHINDWMLSEAALFQVFKTAEEEGAAIFVHPWDMLGQGAMRKYFLPWLVGMPMETSLAICSLMFGGVLERLPNLRVCFAHGGGSYACTYGRVQHGFDVRPDLCAVDCSTPPLAQHGRFWTDSLVHDPDVLNLIVKVFGEDHVCMGTDYPFPLGEFTAASRGTEYAAGQLIDSMPWSTERKEKVLGKNALQWLRTPIETFRRK